MGHPLTNQDQTKGYLRKRNLSLDTKGQGREAVRLWQHNPLQKPTTEQAKQSWPAKTRMIQVCCLAACLVVVHLLELLGVLKA